MSTLVIIGTQWGDEGKGKITDLLSENYDVIARYQGGSNAGHTVVIDSEQFIFHLLPSGILHPGKICLIGNGVVLDPEVLFGEISSLEARGVHVSGRLLIDYKTHLIFPYHKIIDREMEEGKGNKKIGTTMRGIGPAYVDKYSRNGIRVCDLIHPDRFEKILTDQFIQKKEFLEKNYHMILTAQKMAEIREQYEQYAKMIRDYVIDGSLFLSEQLANHKNILFEGAQGTMLDVDHGTYPYVTSSNPVSGCVCTGCGISPVYIDRVIGITKAYTTRVGEGPFPTELEDSTGQKIRDIGHEYGATTGRPRRCGWFDAPVVKYANRINGIKEMVLTKLDVLSAFQKIKICREYLIHNQVYSSFPADSGLVQHIYPVYEEVDGWMEDISNIKKYEDLPDKTKRYIEKLEFYTGSKITLISVGPNRSQTIVR